MFALKLSFSKLFSCGNPPIPQPQLVGSSYKEQKISFGQSNYAKLLIVIKDIGIPPYTFFVTLF